jgi:hypothetical protein
MPIEIIKPRTKVGYCGPASLAWACYELTGYYPSQKHIATEIEMDEAWGTNGDQMLAGAVMLGFTGEWVQKSLDDLSLDKQEGCAVILNWMSGGNDQEDGHYSPLEWADKDVVVIQDPEWIGSIKIMNRQMFERVWYDITETGEKQEKWALVVKKNLLPG